MLSPGYLVEPDAMSLDHILKVAQQILGMSTTFMFYMDDTAMYVQQVFHGTADHVHLESGAIAPIDTTYCQFVYRSGQALRVNDSASDTLFRELKTTKDIGIGSYVGVPLITHDGTIIGTLCGLNPIKSAITDEQLALL